MSSSFRCQPFVAVPGKLGGRGPVVEDVLSSHDQKIYPTTSLDENCIESEFQTGQFFYDHLRQTSLTLKLKLVKGRGYETFISKEVKREQKEQLKADVETEEEQKIPVLFVIYVNKILHSIFYNVDVYINNQQIYNSNGLYAHKPLISNNFQGTISEYQEVLNCEVYDYEEFIDEIIEASLSEPFFTRRLKTLSTPDGFILCGELEVHFSTFELL